MGSHRDERTFGLPVEHLPQAASHGGETASRPGSSRAVLAAFAVATVAIAMAPAAAFAQHVTAPTDPCFFQSRMYSNGSKSCQGDMQYRCAAGAWEFLGLPCSGEFIATDGRPCAFGGINYSSGAESCQQGAQYRCENGMWRGVDSVCQGQDAQPTPIAHIEGGESCRYEAITVSTGSSVCQTGVAYLCNDGQWVNLGTMCR
jgi:hypothetical protein